MDRNSEFHRQQGVALMLSMIMLLVLSLLVITAMQSSTVQEKMTGNVREIDQAFQRAEEITRQVEDDVRVAKLSGVLGAANIETWQGVGLQVFDCSAKMIINDPQFGSGNWGSALDGGDGEYRAIAMSGVAGRAVACRPIEAEPEVGASQRSSYYLVLSHAKGPATRGEALVVTSYFIEE